jgi:hypothetical protein
MLLIQNDIERRAEDILRGYMGGTVSDNSCRIDVDALARRLGLRVCRMRLSDDGTVLGITTYVDTEVELKRYCRRETLRVPRNIVLLDESLYGTRAVPGRRRYTIAHECAHQILWRDEPNERRRSLRTHSMRTTSRRTGQDVQTERQADEMAAALLMPAVFVSRLTERFARGRKLVSYGGRFNPPDKVSLANIGAALNVSHTALVIRLRRLGYLYDLPRDEYYDPTEVWPDE